MFVHHVLFWLKEGLEPGDVLKFETGMKSLLQIEHVSQGDIGKPTGNNKQEIERTYTYSLLLLFNSHTDHALYQPHPLHRKFIDECSPLFSKVLIFDSESIL
jgi:hypothetical protein